jgi:hypothetical protein
MDSRRGSMDQRAQGRVMTKRLYVRSILNPSDPPQEIEQYSEVILRDPDDPNQQAEIAVSTEEDGIRIRGREVVIVRAHAANVISVRTLSTDERVLQSQASLALSYLRMLRESAMNVVDGLKKKKLKEGEMERRIAHLERMIEESRRKS